MEFSETEIQTIHALDGTQLVLHIWEPSSVKGVILAIHGGMAHGGDYVTPAMYFMEKGYAMVAPDLRGHKKEKVDLKNFDLYLTDIMDVYKWMLDRYADLPLFVFGHSMGGLIATVLGLKFPTEISHVKGFVLSSPYFKNAVPVPKILVILTPLFAFLTPRMKVPAEDFLDYLTHDEEITARHHEDERKGLRGKYVTVRWAHQIMKGQSFVEKHISEWRFPLYVVVAGQDKLADTSYTEKLLQQVIPSLLKFKKAEGNYHENFNETNRLEIYEEIFEWMNSVV